jgi:general secretion pathway protein L
MARILGLDLGSYAVKGLVVETTAKGPVARAWAEVKRAPEGDRNDTLREAVKTLLADPQLQADQVVVALPGPGFATHTLSLPFSDPKRIEAALPFEIEAQLPFDLARAVFDYQPAGARDGKTELLVGVVRREELQELLAQLALVNVDPRIVTHPAMTYQNLLLGSPAPFGEGAGAVAIIDLGHERSGIAIGSVGGPIEFARSFAGGGKDLSRVLASEFQTAVPEAHQWKEQHGALGSHVNGPDAERAAAAFIRGLQPILREIRPSLKAYTARTRKTVDRVFLVGGTARLPGLAEQLTRDLGLPTRVLELPAESIAGVVPPEVQPSAAQAFSLAARGAMPAAKAPRFNLRRGEFAFKGEYDYLRERMPRLLAFAATLIVLLLGYGIVRNTVLARREAQVDQALCQTTQRVLGTCEKDYNRALAMLRGHESPAAALPRLSAVNILSELTQRVPKDTPVTFDQIVIDLDRMTLRGTTESNRSIDKVISSLKGFRCFRDVKQGKVEKAKDGNSVIFRLDVQIECPEAAAQAQG